jgi:hypothetical protein
MTKKINFTKMAIVVILTVLIWVWADRAKTEEFTITGAVIKVDTSADPKLWMSIKNSDTATIDNIVLEGSTSNVDKARREIRDRKLEFEFFLNPQQFPELQEEGVHSISLTDFLRTSALIRQLGLSVKSCIPSRIDVQMQKLEEKQLNIECFDDKGVLLKPETIEPPKAAVFVPSDWTDSARVVLTSAEINQAKSAAISKQPFIRLPDGQIKTSADSVKVKLSSNERLLPEYTLKRPRIGFVLGQNLVGKYTVELLNPQNVYLLTIRATPEARDVYEGQLYQILLYIADDDAKKPGEEQERKVDYNFPKQFVENGEIQLKGEPVPARFKLVPITTNPPT